MPHPHDTVIAHVQLTVGGVSLETHVPVPKTPQRPRDLLPIFRAFAGAFENVAVEAMAEAGKKISCRKGCGACCRQLVPVALAEVHMLRDLVDALPEPRRSEVRGRFVQAQAKLLEAGMTNRLTEPGRLGEESVRALSDQYFVLGIACPFLEEESCSIHPDRPIRCREYLVTSPAEHCARPSNDDIKTIPLPAKTSVPLMRLDDDDSDPYLRWVPLTLALSYADSHPEQPPAPGPEIFGRFLTNVGKEPDYVR
jgi:Fe-S-cluster containining protein